MTTDDLKECLRRELDRWSAKPFDMLVAELAETVVYTTDAPESCQVEVQMLEHDVEYIHIGIAVDDGGLRAFVPVSTSFIVYRNGRLEEPEL